MRRLFVPVAVLYALAWTPFLVLGEGGEMVRLQTAGSTTEALTVMAGWSAGRRTEVAFLVGVDFLHLVLYTVLMVGGALWAGRQTAARLAPLARLVAGVAVVGASFDVIENVGLVAMILGTTDSPVPALTAASSIAKFACLGVVAIYVLGIALSRMRGRRRRASATPMT